MFLEYWVQTSSKQYYKKNTDSSAGWIGSVLFNRCVKNVTPDFMIQL